MLTEPIQPAQQLVTEVRLLMWLEALYLIHIVGVMEVIRNQSLPYAEEYTLLLLQMILGVYLLLHLFLQLAVFKFKEFWLMLAQLLSIKKKWCFFKQEHHH